MWHSRSLQEVHWLHKLKEEEEDQKWSLSAAATVPAIKQALLVYFHLICVCGNAVFVAFIAL